MSEYIPYTPVAADGFEKPDKVTQLFLQSAYGWIMHQIKDALDEFIHEGAEQAIREFNYAAKYGAEPQKHDLVLDYLADLMDSPWIEEKASDIASMAGLNSPKADIEMALRSILRASHARLNHAIRVATADAVSQVSAPLTLKRG